MSAQAFARDPGPGPDVLADGYGFQLLLPLGNPNAELDRYQGYQGSVGPPTGSQPRGG